MDKPRRQLSFHGPQTPRELLQELAAWTPPEWEPDRYGSGGLINDFEAEMARLLGHEAAVFMPSGTMCQQIALRLWCDRQASKHIAFHPTAHLEIHEQQAYQHLHGLKASLVGSPTDLMTLDDLARVELPLAALLIELPQREIGGQLPSWEQLQAMVAWARAHGVCLHLDGARLWECQPFYGREYAEIAGLFDTVYVSLYKIIGALAGAVLAGPQALIDEAKIWRRRHGGELVTMSPLVISARKNMTERLDKIPQYVAKAREIAAGLRQFAQIRLVPDPPPTNMCHVYLWGEKAALEKAGEAVREQMNLTLFWRLRDSALSGHVMFEFVAGDATLQLAVAEVQAAFELLFRQAQDGRPGEP